MTLVVPYDGSELSRTALARATQFDELLDEGVLAVTVVPDNEDYARERGWLREGDSFDKQTVDSRLREQVQEINPDARFESIGVSRYAQAGEIASKVRKFARNNGASIVFLGSDNVGRFARSVSSIGGTVAVDRAYDTMIISKPGEGGPPELEEKLPTEELIE